VTVMMYMRNPEKEMAGLDLSPATVVVLIIAVVGILQMGISPSAYMNLARQSVVTLM
jgi:NADH:ubiquinone oxidoreductase subunit 2 (subunit N)